MSGEDTVGEVVDWTSDHKPLALGIVGAVVVGLIVMRLRRSNSANGTSGATAGAIGGASLIPYESAPGTPGASSDFTGLTDTANNGFSILSDQLSGITGLLTTLQPPGSAAIGGSDIGNTVPTPGAAGTGAATGLVSVPKAVPDPNTTVLVPTPAAPASAPPSNYYVSPVDYSAPATDPNNLPPNYPTTVAPAPTIGGNIVAGDYYSGPSYGVPTNARVLTSYSDTAVQQLLAGKTVLNGGTTPYKLVPGTNYAVPV